MESFADKPRLGISACLLGQKVRYDGGHNRDDFLTETVGPHVEWVPICPEVEVGMGDPREALRFGGTPPHPKMIGQRSGRDWTAEMNSFAAKRVEALTQFDLAGYVFKKNSPSCGVERVKVYNFRGIGLPQGHGLLAASIYGGSSIFSRSRRNSYEITLNESA